MFWSYVQSWGARGFSSLSFLVIGAYVGPTEFGLFAVVSAFLFFVELVCDQSLSLSLVQIEHATPAQVDAAFYSALLLGALLAVAMATGAPWLAGRFQEPELATLLRIAAVCPLLIAAAAVPSGLLRRELRFKSLAQRTIMASAVSSALGIALVMAGFGAVGLLVQAICYYTVSLVMLWRHCAWRPSGRFGEAAASLAGVLRLSLANLVNKLFDFGETRGVELLVASIAGVQALGVLAFASKIAQTAFVTLAAPVLDVVFSGVARSAGPARTFDAIRHGQLIIGTVPAAGLLWLSIGAGPLLQLLYGDKWTAAALPLRLLALGYLLRALIYVFSTTLLALRASRAALIVGGVRATAAVVVAWLALRNDPTASSAAWGFLAGAVVAAPEAWRWTARACGLPAKALIEVPLSIFAAALAMLVVHWGLDHLAGADGRRALFIAIADAAVFLAVVVSLNTRLIVHGLAPTAGTGKIGRLLSPVLFVAQRLVAVIDAVRLAWFSLTLRLAIALHRRPAAARKTPWIVAAPGAHETVGHEVLLRTLASPATGRAGVTWVVDERHAGTAPAGADRLLRAWSGWRAGWLLGRESVEASAVYVIGPDAPAGADLAADRQRLALLDALARAGVACTLTGFSVDATLAPALVSAFRRLPADVRLCLRDPLSLERFERLTHRRATLVADLAFLGEGDAASSPVAESVRAWVDRQRAEGRLLLGISLAPLATPAASGVEERIAESIGACCARLADEGCSVLLMGHDAVGSDGPRVMRLDETVADRDGGRLWRELDLLLCARLRPGIGGLSMGIAVCALRHRDNVEGLLKHFGFGAESVISCEDAMEPDKLHRFLARHLEQAPALRAQVHARLPQVRALAWRNIHAEGSA